MQDDSAAQTTIRTQTIPPPFSSPGRGRVSPTRRKNEEEDVSSYWMRLRKREDIGI
jgi:hypothetical protein